MLRFLITFLPNRASVKAIFANFWYNRALRVLNLMFSNLVFYKKRTGQLERRRKFSVIATFKIFIVWCSIYDSKQWPLSDNRCIEFHRNKYSVNSRLHPVIYTMQARQKNVLRAACNAGVSFSMNEQDMI